MLTLNPRAIPLAAIAAGFVVGVGGLQGGAVAAESMADWTGEAGPKSALQSAPQSAPQTLTEPAASPPAIAPTMVSQVPNPTFGDVSPRHWAATAVGNLVQNYQCLAGYPDGTFQGDRPVTRDEFAAALDACLREFVGDRPGAAGTLNDILQDLEAMQQELGALGSDLDTLQNAAP